MKTLTLTTFLILVAASLFAQLPGKKSFVPLRLFNEVTVHAGDTVHLGKGSDATTGGFVYITSPDEAVSAQMYGIGTPGGKLGTEWSEQWVILDYFKVKKRKDGPTTTLGRINVKGKMYSYGINFEQAILAGEIIAIGSQNVTRFQQSVKVDTSTPLNAPGRADQIRELKALLDEGLITEEEYKQGKARILKGENK